MRHIFLPAALFLAATSLHAENIFEPLLNTPLAPEWQLDLAEGKGTIFPGDEGVVFQAEAKRHVLMKRKAIAPGTDERPLSVSVILRTTGGLELPLQNGLWLYWDEKNYVGLRATHDSHVYCTWRVNGESFEDGIHNVMREVNKREKEIHVRIQLVSRNAVLCVGDGRVWRKAVELGRRPGADNEPPLIVLGRGMPGEKPELGNDLNGDKGAITKVSAREFRVGDEPRKIGVEDVQLPKQETWEKTIAPLAAAGIPKSWTLLGPFDRPMYDQRVAMLQDENWNAKRNDSKGKPARAIEWKRPDEDSEDSFVDLREIMDQGSAGVAFARTEIDWPIDGEALLWLDSGDTLSAAVNGTVVYNSDKSAEWQERRAEKDRRAAQVFFKKGRNRVQLAARQNKGEWGFYFRVERNDPAYRISLLRKLIEYFPEDWRAGHAWLEIARVYENADRYAAAVSAYHDALAHVAGDDELRIQAFENEIRVRRFLRDYPGMQASAESYLGAYPRRDGAEGALRALLFSLTLQGKHDAALARAEDWAKSGVLPARAEMLRVIAGAGAVARDTSVYCSVMERLASENSLAPRERAAAVIQSAMYHWQQERRRAGWWKPLPPEGAAAACKIMASAVELMPNRTNPMIQSLVQEADTDLRENREPRAFGGYWAAALLALASSDAESAQHFALSAAYKIPLQLKDKDREVTDANEYRSAVLREFAKQMGDPVWAGKWRSVFFSRDFDDVAKCIEQIEANSDPATKFGKNRKGWNELDDDGDREMDEMRDLRKNAGNGHVMYLAREFDSPAAVDTVLQLSVGTPWAAWLDGKLLGRELTGDEFRFEADRIPVHLDAGKHRILLRLDIPPDGAIPFRARFCKEPQLATCLAAFALTVRHIPTNSWDRRNDFEWLRNFSSKKIPNASHANLAWSISMLYDDNIWTRNDTVVWTAARLHESRHYAQCALLLEELLARLESSYEYGGRQNQIWDAAWRLSQAHASGGHFARADRVLRDACNRHVLPPEDFQQGLVQRGNLRRDIGMAAAALPFFERAVREGRITDNRDGAPSGLNWARSARPERLNFESSHEALAALDAVQRQLAAGADEDIERAARGINELMKSAPNVLIKEAQTPFSERYAGLREFVGALLRKLPANVREKFEKASDAAAAVRLVQTKNISDPQPLEAAASEFPHSAAGRQALNRAANLYYDRGSFGQAASLYQALMRDESRVSPLLLYKLARALAFDGQAADAVLAASRLANEFSNERVELGNGVATGEALAKKLNEQIKAHSKQNGPAAGGSNFTATVFGNLKRTGVEYGPSPDPAGLLWARPLITSGMQENARSAFPNSPLRHLQSHPVALDGIIFTSAMESVRAIDAGTGRVVWTQTWSGGGAPNLVAFPASCPTAANGRLFLRAAEQQRMSLRCYDAHTGTLRWNTDRAPELRRFFWTSDPAFAYGMIFATYVVAGDFDAHGVAALDAATGRLRWNTPLVSGASGLRVNIEFRPATLHMGPAAIDDGEIFVTTGLCSIAALNAFSGEARWVSSYPRAQFGSFEGGSGYGQYNTTLRTMKAFSSGPLSPVLWNNLVIVAPKDGNGITAFDRKTGEIRWKREMLEARFVAGICNGNLILCDDGVTALDARDGTLAWTRDLKGQQVAGQPALSGNVLYLPGDSDLQRIDARNGTLIGAAEWDRRVGPVGNILVLNESVVGVSERVIAAFGRRDGTTARLPLQEARELETAGKLADAATAYAGVISARDAEDLPLALSAHARILKQLNRSPEAFAALDKLAQSAPAMLSASGGLWEVRRDNLISVLRARLNSAPEFAGDPNAPAKSGLLTFAWQLPGDTPILSAASGSQDRFFTKLNGDVLCIQARDFPEQLWKTYVGTNVRELIHGPGNIAALSDQNIVVLDRGTGEPVSEVTLFGAARGGRERDIGQLDRFVNSALSSQRIFAATESRLLCWDLATGQRLWSRATERGRVIANGLIASGRQLYHVHTRSDEIIVSEIDPDSGTSLRSLQICRSGDSPAASCSPDGKKIICRGSDAIACVELGSLGKMWQIGSSVLDHKYASVDFLAESVKVSGPSRNDRGKWSILYLDPENGHELSPANAEGPVYKFKNDYLMLSRDWGRVLTRRADRNGNFETVWTNTLPEPAAVEHYLQRVSLSGKYLHLIYARARDNRDQFLLRTLSWENGQILKEQILPGTPARIENNAFSTRIADAGSMLLYSAREGVFALAAAGDLLEPFAAAERKLLRDGKLPAARAQQLRQSLANIAQPEILAFVAPENLRIDGDLSEWRNVAAFQLHDRAHFAPLNARANWKSETDFGARMYAAWNREGVAIAVDVNDDSFVPPRAGSETLTGDRLRIVIDAGSEPGYALNPESSCVATLAFANGRAALISEAQPEEAEVQIRGEAVRAPNARGYQYELFVPWALIRKSPNERPGERRALRLGAAVYDDDNDGEEYALEFGAGVTAPDYAAMWLGRAELLDISREKIDRYRKIIELIPNAPESLKYLQLILLSLRGPNEYRDQSQELEAYVRAHPGGAHTLTCFLMLRSLHAQAGAADAQEKVVALARSVNCPAYLLGALTAGTAAAGTGLKGEYFEGVDLNIPRKTRLDAKIDFMWNDVPPIENQLTNYSARWTGVLMPKVTDNYTLYTVSDDGVRLWINNNPLIDNWTLHALSEDRAAISLEAGCKYAIRLEYFQANGVSQIGLQWSSTSQARETIPQENLFPAGEPTKTVNPVVPADSGKEIELLRRAALLVNDTPEALNFIRRAIDLQTGEPNEKNRRAISELETFLRSNPSAHNAIAVLKMLRAEYEIGGEREPIAKCDQLLRDCRLPRDVTRAFYAEFAPVWSEWRVLGPFAASGERRGMDVAMEPERAVDLNWKTVVANKEIAWRKISNLVRRDGKPNYDPFVDLRSHLAVPQDVSRSPYFAYAYAKFTVPGTRRALLAFGAQEAASIWLNGKRVVSEAVTLPEKDKELVPVTLRGGENEVLIKVGVSRERAGFIFRIADLDGKPFGDIRNE